MKLRVLRNLVVLVCALAGVCSGAEADLSATAVSRRVADGVGVLDRLYWSPTLEIWLDRPGDDLRGFYDGRVNPPWWSAANAVEVLLDFEKATGRADYDAKIAALFEMNRDTRNRSPEVIAELKRRRQWSEADEKARGQKTGGRFLTDFCNEYLDDSGWWGLAWLKMFDRTHDGKYLAVAKAVHAHMAKSWRPDRNGGVMWSEEGDKQIPNAIENSLFLVLSARLFERTHDAAYLKWAEQELEWFHAAKLYDGRGVVDSPGHHRDYWTYNQGVFIGGLTALFQATGNQEYLDEAATVADSVMNRAGVVLPDGVIIEKLGTNGWDPGLFKGVFIRYLAQLRDVLNARKLHPDIARQLDRCIRSSADSMIRNSLGDDGQFSISWHEGATDQTRNFNTQTSALCALVAVLPDQHP